MSFLGAQRASILRSTGILLRSTQVTNLTYDYKVAKNSASKNYVSPSFFSIPPQDRPARPSHVNVRVDSLHNPLKVEADQKAIANTKTQAKTVKEIEAALPHVDFVLEVRDARAPFTTEVKRLHASVCKKPRVIVMNKVDLSDASMEQDVLDFYRHHGIPCVYFYANSVRNHLNIDNSKALYDAIDSLPVIRAHKRASMAGIVVGAPNVGKTALIRRLRIRGRRDNIAHIAAAHVPRPGWMDHDGCKPINFPNTTNMFFRHIVRHVPYALTLIDTPGIYVPYLYQQEEAALKLSALRMLPDGTGITAVLAFGYVLQYIMNTPRNRGPFLSYLGVTEEEAEEKVREPEQVLQRVAAMKYVRQNGWMTDMQNCNVMTEEIARQVVSYFAKGLFGPVQLDRLPADIEAVPTEVISNASVTARGFEESQSAIHRAGTVMNPRNAIALNGMPVSFAARDVSYGSWRSDRLEDIRPSWVSQSDNTVDPRTGLAPRNDKCQGPAPLDGGYKPPNAHTRIRRVPSSTAYPVGKASPNVAPYTNIM